MKQLAVQNGDFVLGAGGFATVTGSNKAKQDLSHALREPIGNDRFHPGWGSTLPGMIGMNATEDARGEIESEVYRVARNYIISRLTLIQQDAQVGRTPQFSTNEIIQSISAVEIKQRGDTYAVRITLKTSSDESVTITTTA